MSTLTRKQREIREREELILQKSREILLERGFHGLTMDRVAEAVEYSKGTVYQHFASKEDVLVALAAQTLRKRTELFERAATFRGRTRERMTAIGVADEIFVTNFPLHARTEKLIHSAAIQSKADQERLLSVANCERRCFDIGLGIVRDAIAQGDLVLPEGIGPEVVTFGLWSVSVGAHFIASGGQAMPFGGDEDPQRGLEWNQQTLLDGYGWKPLSSEWDYDATRRRIEDEVFAEEIRELTHA